MKYWLILLLVLIIPLIQSCGSLHGCRDAKDLSQGQAQEIYHQQQLIDALTQLDKANKEEQARLNEKLGKILLEYDQLRERLQDMAGAGAKTTHNSGPVAGVAHEFIEYEPLEMIPFKKIDTLTGAGMKISSGNVAFYCPRKVNYKETFTAIGFITEVISDERIKAKLTQRVKEIERDSAGVELSEDKILIEKIRFHKLVELKLDPASNGSFEIIKVHLEDKQEVTPGMEGWQWNILPVSTEKDQKLVLKVIVYDENGKVDSVFNKTRFVDIEVNSFAFFRNTKVLFVQNPEWAFGSVILPFITFLAGNYQRRRKEKAGLSKEEPAKSGAA